MTLIDRLGSGLSRAPVTVDLDDIQATVLRYRPEPYYGTHVMLHVAGPQAGREFLRRLTPHVDSAADWWQAGASWISVAISYTGLADRILVAQRVEVAWLSAKVLLHQYGEARKPLVLLPRQVHRPAPHRF